MISLSGLSATYPGYAAQEDQTAKTQANQAAAREAAIKLLGAHVLGQALVGQGPQPPAPGQASVPSAPPAVPGAAGPTSVGGAPLPPPPSAPPGGAPQVPPAALPGPAAQPPAAVQAPATGGAPALPEISLQGLTQRILQTSPGIINHPELLIAALDHAKPMLDAESKSTLDDLKSQFKLQQIKQARERLNDAIRYHGMVTAPPAAATTAPSGPAPAAGPTATDPKTGAKVQWDGKTWAPMPTN